MKLLCATAIVLMLQVNLIWSFRLPGKLSAECGHANPDSFIIGGNETVPNRYPWMAMQRQGDDQIGCGAALISDEWLITAAHCSYDISNLYVALGGHDMRNPNEPNKIRVKVEKQINHEEYDFPHNDIALMKLAEKVEFNDYIRPICLPTRTEAENEFWGVDVKAIGWGYANNADGPSGLREVDLTTITQDQQIGSCTRASTPSVICIQTNRGTVGVCYGDSGSPLLYPRPNGQYITVGVASFVIGDCELHEPNGYNSVLHHLDWIEKNTGIQIEP